MVKFQYTFESIHDSESEKLQKLSELSKLSKAFYTTIVFSNGIVFFSQMPDIQQAAESA